MPSPFPSPWRRQGRGSTELRPDARPSSRDPLRFSYGTHGVPHAPRGETSRRVAALRERTLASTAASLRVAEHTERVAGATLRELDAQSESLERTRKNLDDAEKSAEEGERTLDEMRACGVSCFSLRGESFGLREEHLPTPRRRTSRAPSRAGTSPTRTTSSRVAPPRKEKQIRRRGRRRRRRRFARTKRSLRRTTRSARTPWLSLSLWTRYAARARRWERSWTSRREPSTTSRRVLCLFVQSWRAPSREAPREQTDRREAKAYERDTFQGINESESHRLDPSYKYRRLHRH